MIYIYRREIHNNTIGIIKPKIKQAQTIHACVYLNAITTPNIVVTNNPTDIKTIRQRKGIDDGNFLLSPNLWSLWTCESDLIMAGGT